MFELIKKIFVGLLTDVNGSNHTKCISLSNKKSKVQATLLNLHPNEYSQDLHYYQFAVKLDWCVESFNTLNNLSSNVCVPNKTEDLYPSMFNIITVINESNTLTKHISHKYECRFDERKCNSDQ